MDLAVPLAFSESLGLAVLPNVAKSDGPFKCLECDAQLVLRQGNVRQYHFAHSSKSRCGGGEGILHKAAKHWFAKSINVATVVAKCCGCGADHTVWKSPGQCLAEEELACKVEGAIKYRIDVAVLAEADHKLMASVEVFHTHRISDEKRAYLSGLGPVFEIRAFNPVSNGFSTTFACADPAGWCDLCDRKRRLEDLCNTLRPLGFLRAFITRRRAKTLPERLRSELKWCSCGRVAWNCTSGPRGVVPVCKHCLVACGSCGQEWHADALVGSLCQSCNRVSRLVECRLCGTKVVDPDSADPWRATDHGSHKEYTTLCPELCTECAVPRMIEVTVWQGRSTRRPCTECETWGAMFEHVFPIKSGEDDYGKTYEWGCRKCRIQCTTCGVYCFNYGGRCMTCNIARKRARKMMAAPNYAKLQKLL